MAPQAPNPAEFQALTFEYKPSGDGCNSNLLLLLHGLGDHPGNFIKAAQSCRIPQMALLAIKGPSSIPFFPEGTGWFPVFGLDGNPIAPSSPHRVKGIVDTRRRLSLLIRYLCCDKGWDPARLFLLGYAQGGSMALDAAICGDWPLALNSSATSLGGVVSISGPFLDEMVQADTPSSSSDFRLNQVALQTPVLLTHGTDDEATPLNEAQAK
ncbi:hypothetical protein H4R35_002885, partial [Dimargaris xerosporica]